MQRQPPTIFHPFPRRFTRQLIQYAYTFRWVEDLKETIVLLIYSIGLPSSFHVYRPMASTRSPNKQLPTSLPITSVSNGSETITNIVFGLCALLVGAVAIWQGRIMIRRWYSYLRTPEGHDQGTSRPLLSEAVKTAFMRTNP